MSSSARAQRILAALALQVAALAALALALAGSAWLDPRSQPRLLVLVDRSHSMPRLATDQALAEVLQAARVAGAGEIQLMEFAGRPASPKAVIAATAARAAPADTTVTAAPAAMAPGAAVAADTQPAATNIEAALQAALAAHAGAAFDGAVLISDGLATAGDTARGLGALRDARLALQWRALGRQAPPVRVAEVLAPASVRSGQRFRVGVQLAGAADASMRVKAVARHAGGQTQTARSPADANGRAMLDFDAGGGGAVVVDVALEDAATGLALHTHAEAAVIDTLPPAALLYARGGASAALASSLRRGGWGLELVAAARLDSFTDALASYQAVVLDDVAIHDANPRFWAAMVAAVRQGGLGLVVLGGERAFARGGYRGSMLESVLPVLSEPPALDEPVSVLFAVDKSGSMGQGSAGVDRFQLAQRAVLETAGGLAPRDSLGLLVFDVAPRLLLPLGPADAGLPKLAQAWPASPQGGTRLVPALEAAVAELERAGFGRRLLVLVSDGFVDDAPLAVLRARLVRARIETLALAVGPDADVVALQKLVGEAAGRVLRVNEAAELPRVMRTGLDQQRARIERGRIAVEQPLPLPFAPGLLPGWPPVNAHAVTRAQPGAVVAVQSRQREPLIAFQNVGRGRVVAVTSGLGPWTLPWLAWREWPGLAGGLANWASGTGGGAGGGADGGGVMLLDVAQGASGLQVEIELPALTEAPAAAAAAGIVGIAIDADTPTRRNLPLATEAAAPGRLRAALADDGPGLYTFTVSTPQGTQRLLHLRRQQAEVDSWGITPALPAWRSAGLVSDWSPRELFAAAPGTHARRPPDRGLIGLALALFLAGVVLDRARPGVARAAWSPVQRVLQRGWQRARQRWQER